MEELRSYLSIEGYLYEVLGESAINLPFVEGDCMIIANDNLYKVFVYNNDTNNMRAESNWIEMEEVLSFIYKVLFLADIEAY